MSFPNDGQVTEGNEEKTQALETNLESLINNVDISNTNDARAHHILVDNIDCMNTPEVNHEFALSSSLSDQSIDEFMKISFVSRKALSPKEEVVPSSYDFDKCKTILTADKDSYERIERSIVPQCKYVVTVVKALRVLSCFIILPCKRLSIFKTMLP